MFQLAIVKLTAACDLNCTYCYMFNQADKTFKRVPRHMPLTTAIRVLERIEEHALEHGTNRFHITLHGGEPTLWPYRRFAALLERVEEMRDRGLRTTVSLQTNAFRYRPQLIRLLASHGVTIGVSIDGPESMNDCQRIDHRGRGTYQQVMNNVRRMLEDGFEETVHGFLSVAQPSISPEEYLEWASQLPIRRLDVLWPMEFHYDNPPWTGVGLEEYAKSPRYGRWFADLFAAWWKLDDPTLYIRFFYDCLLTLLGSTHHVENIVNDTVPIFVMNTDGQYEYHDYLRSYGDAVCRTGLSVDDSSLSSLANNALFSFLLNLRDHLPNGCEICSVKEICGGGFLSGRAKPGEQIPMRKSVLCLDQYYFFRELSNKIGVNLLIDAEEERRTLARSFITDSAKSDFVHLPILAKNI